MNITQLPGVVLTTIIRKLDFKSQENLCNTSRFFREMICGHPVIRVCDLSMSTMATANTLKCTFFQDISGHLRELNLSAVNDLDKETLLPTIQQLARLDTLDISYTDLTIMDLPDIQTMRPTLRNITINFTFAWEQRFNDAFFQQYQLVFEHYKNVHIVACINIIDIIFFVAFRMLNKAKLNTLKFTFARLSRILPWLECCEYGNLPQFNELNIYLLHWKLNYNYTSIRPVAPLAKLRSQSIELIIIVMRNEFMYKVFATPLFHEFFKDYFNVEAETITNTSTSMKGNVAIMAWNKNTTEFDNNFYYKLRQRLRRYLPYYCNTPETPAPREFEWFCISQKVHGVMTNENHENVQNHELVLRDNKETATNHVLNYDSTFRDHSKIRLKLFFRYFRPGTVTLTADCDFLRKLTYLSLSGKVDYSPEFFNVLFRCCDSLVTLNVDAAHAHIHGDISESISLSQSLKNFRLVQPHTAPINELIASLSNCTTLEIIHIVEEIDRTRSRRISSANLSMLLDKCDNLLNFYLETWLSIQHRSELLKMLDEYILRLNKLHISVAIECRYSNMEPVYEYDPYLDVFNVTAVKPV